MLRLLVYYFIQEWSGHANKATFSPWKLNVMMTSARIKAILPCAYGIFYPRMCIACFCIRFDDLHLFTSPRTLGVILHVHNSISDGVIFM